MRMTNIPFGITDWSAVAETHHSGESGEALWRTQQFGDIRVRLVRYSAGYLADHWCDKGHILFCLEGDLTTELRDGRVVVERGQRIWHGGGGSEDFERIRDRRWAQKP